MEGPFSSGVDNCIFGDRDCLVELLDILDDIAEQDSGQLKNVAPSAIISSADIKERHNIYLTTKNNHQYAEQRP